MLSFSAVFEFLLKDPYQKNMIGLVFPKNPDLLEEIEDNKFENLFGVDEQEFQSTRNQFKKR